MAYVKVGDVLQMPSGTQRVVRKVSFFENGDLRSCHFAIRKCSWTGRAYTCYGFTDLMRWHFVMARPLPATKLDEKLARDMRYSKRFDQRLDCCAVRGMP